MPENNYTEDRDCPVYGREIGCELCFETVMTFEKILISDAVPELDNVKDMETARKNCEKCPYSTSWEE